MTKPKNESSKNFTNKKINKPIINPDPRGNWLFKSYLWINPINNVDKEPIKITGAKLIGPIKEPMPPRSKKSPPPIPSCFLNNLKQKFISHKIE